MNKILLPLITALFMPLISIAETTFTQSTPAPSFYDYAKAIPLTLIHERKIDKIGKLDLKDVVKKIDQIPVIEKDWVETEKDNGKSRIFARWEITEQGPTISLNKKVWNQVFQEKNDVLALHEVFGGLGYDDENYNLSLSLWILAADSKKQLLSPKAVKEIKRNIKDIAASKGGGVIGVGGGGDLTAIYVKTYAIQAAYTRLQQDPTAQEDFMTSYWVVNALRMEVGWKNKNGSK